MVRNRPRDRSDLERITGRRRVGRRCYRDRATLHQFYYLASQRRIEAGLLAVGEERADLDAGGTECERLLNVLLRRDASADPERHLEGAQHFVVDSITFAIVRIAGVVEHERAAGRRVV